MRHLLDPSTLYDPDGDHRAACGAPLTWDDTEREYTPRATAFTRSTTCGECQATSIYRRRT